MSENGRIESRIEEQGIAAMEDGVTKERERSNGLLVEEREREGERLERQIKLQARKVI